MNDPRYRGRAPAPPARRRRWATAVAALAVVLALLTAGTGAWWFLGDGSEQWARWHWQPPAQVLLPPMEIQPIPGWRSNVTDLGLPADAKFTTDGTDVPGPVIKTSGPRTYLLASSSSPATTQWWLAGVNPKHGRAPYPPVALNATSHPPSCFINGTSVVCLADDGDATTAWVIDGISGQLLHTGPSEMKLQGNRLRARQVGDYLLAQTEKEGVHGVGPDADTTWFVAGVGIIAAHDDDLAFQSQGEGSGSVLFELGHGAAVQLELPHDARVQTPKFFDGGFAASVVGEGEPSAIQFFESRAKPISRTRIGGLQTTDTTANLVAILEDRDHWGIYTPEGSKLLGLPADRAGTIHLIGSTLWVGADTGGSPRVQPYDLRTGDAGAPCNVDLNGYLGTDGTVALRAPTNARSDDLAQAFDLTTCRLAWSIPRPAGSLARLTAIGDTLVQLSDDGTELMSLVAPS
ncbi:hypothetical protein [Mycolicibacterium hodleri]|uniref:Uncharacterized protein n=1 Tax=Mycolicibacterium hodleri TaxID=49897 RepID=A0A502DX79_9MYCO|nr:hypothetical protein [Mycolicibacterium hodleri]TPG29714.1 hypothetical protein EAH80_26135 [Mycolicibacterium hodleri]